MDFQTYSPITNCLAKSSVCLNYDQYKNKLLLMVVGVAKITALSEESSAL